jgi:hypothetical protein
MRVIAMQLGYIPVSQGRPVRESINQSLWVAVCPKARDFHSTPSAFSKS